MFRIVFYPIFLGVLLSASLPIEKKTPETISISNSTPTKITFSTLPEYPKENVELKKHTINKTKAPPKEVKKQKKHIKKTVKNKTKKKHEPITKTIKKLKTQQIDSVQVKHQSIVKKERINSLKKNQEQTYYSKLYQCINTHKRYPKQAIKFAQEDEVVVTFQILKDGSIKDLKIINPSTYSILNKEVKKMFKRIKMFEELPEFIKAPLVITTTINFTLTKELK